MNRVGFKAWWLGVWWVLALGGASLAVAAEDAGAPPAEVAMGAYLLRLSNVSQKDGTFNVDMWVWFRWKGDDLKPY